jgi:hypothetical protein
MFAHHEPWDCSNSVANLGPRAGELTWGNALAIAKSALEGDGSAPEWPYMWDWLATPLADALNYIRGWARETGAWDRAEIEAWSDEECLALLVQNVADDLRLMGADDQELAECVATYQDTDWEAESEYPTLHIWNERGETFGELSS